MNNLDGSPNPEIATSIREEEVINCDDVFVSEIVETKEADSFFSLASEAAEITESTIAKNKRLEKVRKLKELETSGAYNYDNPEILSSAAETLLNGDEIGLKLLD